MSMRRVLAVLVVLVLANAAFLGWRGLSGPQRSPVIDGACFAASFDQLDTGKPDTTRCDRVSPEPVVDGRPIPVTVERGPAFRVGAEPWRAGPMTGDPTWRLNVYSLDWVTPLVRRALQDGQTEARGRLLNTVLDFYRVNPDPGTNENGWDEGTSLRRLEALSCLYTMTSERRLIPAMEAEAKVLLGDRYYGPPNFPVHNHGLMANARLIQAGLLIDRPDWVRTASQRMKDELGQAFSPAGTSLEQSSGYQLVNANMWADAGRLLAQVDPHDPFLAELRDTLAQVRGVAAWLTEPDGQLVQLGNSGRRAGLVSECTVTPGVFRDDDAGLIIGRRAWQDPHSVYFTLRYGPPQWAHGHPDQGSFTWTAGGHRVLVGSGYYGHDRGDPYVQYGQSPLSANVAMPAGASSEGPDGFGVVRVEEDGGAQSVSLAGAPFGVRAHRLVVVDPGSGGSYSVTVQDDLPDDRGSGLAQHWLLDPAWTAATTPANGQVTLTHSSGATLRVESPGATITLARGGTKPVAGWVFPTPGTREPAYQLTISGTGNVKTTFRLTSEANAQASG